MSGRRGAAWGPGIRSYRWLLGVLPWGLDGHWREEAVAVFAAIRRDAIERHGRMGGWAVWIRAVVTLLFAGITERRSEPPPAADAMGRGGAGGRRPSATVQAVSHALRGLRGRRGFALAVIGILATGIGATATMFSVVDAVLLRELPYPEADRLIHFDEGAHSYPTLRAWEEMTSFDVIAASHDFTVTHTGGDRPQRLRAAAVSPGFFEVFNARPSMGRLFGPDDHPGDRSVVLMSHGLWTSLGADPAVVGSVLLLDDLPATVAGVVDPSFIPPELETGARVDLWFALDDGGEDAEEHGYHVLSVAGRLGPGVDLAAAQAEVDAIRMREAEVSPDSYVYRDGSVQMVPLVPLHEATVSGVSARLLFLLGAVGMLLLLACANVANLSLAQGTTRRREIALRSALGAGRARIAGEVLAESVILAVLGGLLGAALAYVGVLAVGRFDPIGIPSTLTPTLDLRVLGFAIAIAIATGIISGTLPALQAVATNMSGVLKDHASAVTGARGAGRVRSGLVVAETAIAVVLVIGAALLMRSIAALTQVETGFEPEGVVTMSLNLPPGLDDEGRGRFLRELESGIAAIPGTRSVAMGWTLPFSELGGSRCCWRTSVEGDAELFDPENPFLSTVHPVSAGYFETFAIPVPRGRAFGPTDGVDEAPAVILDDLAAEALFGEADPLGRQVVVGGETVRTVVGIAGTLNHWGLSEPREPGVYIPYPGRGDELPWVEIAVRTDQTLATLAPALREAVWALDADTPVETVRSMEEVVHGSLASPRLLTGLLGSFAALAFLLAIAGIYAMMAYSVGRRRREMGLRRALGATGRSVIVLVVRHGMLLGGAGVLVGLVLAFALSGVMEDLVWGIQPTDLATFAGTAFVLAAAAGLASLIPAWSASRSDPVQTLRSD